jgi:predicted PurR-regulated permease PerM
LLSAQVIGGAVAGIFGIGLAAPIALVFTVIIQLGYIQDVIGEEPHLPSGHISEGT